MICACKLALIKDFIVRNHYSRKTAPTSFAFAMYEGKKLIGAITFGQPASPWVKVSIRGKEGCPVIELNRLAIKSDIPNCASILIGYALRHLPKNILVVSYADKGVGHIGYVYQATNWNYAGETKARTDIYSESGHARHHCGDPLRRQFRSSKYRYWISTGKIAKNQSLWKSLPYPKGNTKRHPCISEGSPK